MTRVFEAAAVVFGVAAAVFWSLYAFGESPQMTPVDDPAFAVSGLAIMTSWAAGLSGAAALCAGFSFLL
jgi:hypothetical protein